MLIGGLVLNGCSAGISGVALIAVPELIPNKYRHIGVVIADAMIYIFNILGPVVARYTIVYGGGCWRYLYWAGFIAETITFIGLAFLYCWFTIDSHPALQMIANDVSSSPSAPPWHPI